MKGCMACANERETAYIMGMKDATDIKCPVCYAEDVEKRTIKALTVEAHTTAVEKGWWETDRSNLECIALMHCELSEAVEAYRKGDEAHVVEELADVLIRTFDLCGRRGWDLERAVTDKMAYNKTRPYRHGGKRA
jgi:NTP pyrophosphatase (non-canonical NTP hydrolase)